MNLLDVHFCLPTDSLEEGIRRIDKNRIQIVFVVDEKKRLVGALSDGDVRRAILAGTKLDKPVQSVMNAKPRSVLMGQVNPQELVKKMLAEGFRQIPVVNTDNVVTDILLLDELLKAPAPAPQTVVIMAGGMGKRLRPLTDDLPKPLLKVGGRPILDILVEQFVNQGFKSIHVAVNYKADMIRSHLGDGSRLGAEIHYLAETTPLGTAGPLSLLHKSALQQPVIAINGDILTNINFESLVQFHKASQLQFTMSVKEYEFQVPYGVINMDQEGIIDSIDEKPLHKFFVNAGIYVLSPEIIQQIPKGKIVDMPDLLGLAQTNSMRTGAFPIREYWLDIGRLDDYQRAQTDYQKYFNS